MRREGGGEEGKDPIHSPVKTRFHEDVDWINLREGAGEEDECQKRGGGVWVGQTT